MERSALEQATDLLTRSGEILLAVPERPTADAFASFVGLSLALEALGKRATMVSASHVPPALQFLPGTSQVRNVLERTADLVMDVPLGSARPANVAWEQRGDVLRFIITPARGSAFQDTTPQIRHGLYPWETIATLGSPDLHHLGAPFTDHATFFYDTPIVNIDRGTTNEFFGAVNLVPATAGTIAEVVYDLVDALGGVNAITPDVATCVFAALLAGTHSFQAPQTTPRTFAVASALLEQDADRQTVTRNLFKTHTLSELRLVGRGLARLSELSDGALWSVLLRKDFAESGGGPDDVPAVLREMVARAGETLPILLAFERTAGTLEALVFPGRVSAEDREAFRARTNGTATGPFVLLTLGGIPPAAIAQTLRDRVLPHLPR